jgi:hypothetical protein
VRLAALKNLEAVVLRSSDARSWWLFPAAVLRVSEFVRKYDSDADPLLMVAQLKQAFIHPRPAAHLMVLLEDNVIVGHLLVIVETWFGTDFATIVQLEIDRPVPRAMARDTMAFIEDWAKEMGCKFIQCMARNEQVARAFKIFHGFERTRVMMKKSLSTADAVVPKTT